MRTPPSRLRSFALRQRKQVLLVVIYKADGKIYRGSGFAIKSSEDSTFVLTCAHVSRACQVADGDKIFVRRVLPSRVEDFPAIVVRESDVTDVAILEVQGATFKRMEFATPEQVAVGDSCFAIGYINPRVFSEPCFAKIAAMCPGDVRNTSVRIGPAGSVSYANTNIQTDCVCSKGMSGGPVISRRGVIGMICNGKPGVMHAISVETIRDVLKDFVDLRVMGGTVQQVLPLLR